MNHWSAGYVGMPWLKDEFDCGTLVERVRREQFGHEIQLTPARRAGPFGRNAQIRQETDSRACQTLTPKDGDLVLLICKARAQHVGVYCVIDGQPWVLHNGQGTGVRLMPLWSLEKWGYRVEGYYQWI